MTTDLSDRAFQLLESASLKELTKLGETDYVRWQNIKRGRAQLRANEVEIIGKAFPNYRWWLMTGEVKPEMGQTSPEYDGANAALKERGEG
ncbi:MAG TPA: DNA-binding protein [Dehalococcoidia bacterium]|nr:DNA-binding protein [Dehalococcoidia bacterium]